MDRRIINLEKDFCWLKAIRRAMKEKTFTIDKGFDLLARQDKKENVILAA